MTSEDTPHFEAGLENLNNFFALPGFWQPIVLALFRGYIEENFIKTRAELVELKAKLDALPMDVSDEILWNVGRPLSEATRVNAFFAYDVSGILTGTTNVDLSTHHQIEPERRERLEELWRTSEYEHLRKFLKDIDVESRDELIHAWTILDVFVSNHSETERDAVAEKRRNRDKL